MEKCIVILCTNRIFYYSISKSDISTSVWEYKINFSRWDW